MASTTISLMRASLSLFHCRNPYNQQGRLGDSNVDVSRGSNVPRRHEELMVASTMLVSALAALHLRRCSLPIPTSWRRTAISDTSFTLIAVLQIPLAAFSPPTRFPLSSRNTQWCKYHAMSNDSMLCTYPPVLLLLPLASAVPPSFLFVPLACPFPLHNHIRT